MTLQIKDFLLANPVITAPMAGVTDRAYREILHQMGAGLVYTEMISDKGLCYGDKKTFSLLNISNEAPPIGVQLCGSEPPFMTDAAKIIEDYNKDKNNIKVLDINMGCPVNKIVKNGEGSKLMTDPEKAVQIVRGIVANVALPVTVKMRLGWDQSSLNVLEFAKRIEDAGAAAITIHGRTRQQMYSGEADWTLIGEAAQKLSIPVIGNGDITTPEIAKHHLEAFGCAGIMIGRGMLGNPWLIRDTINLLEGKPMIPSPSLSQIIDMAIQHLDRQVELNGEYLGIRQMRTHLPWYIKGKRGAAALRGRINQLGSAKEIKELLIEYVNQNQE